MAGVGPTHPVLHRGSQFRLLHFHGNAIRQRPETKSSRRRSRREKRARATALAPAIEDLEREVDIAQPSSNGKDRSHITDYVVIGSGIGGERIA